MSKDVEGFAEATTFAIKSMQLAIERLAMQIEGLEAAFLKLHPSAMLPAIPQTEAEKMFLEAYAHLLEDPK